MAVYAAEVVTAGGVTLSWEGESFTLQQGTIIDSRFVLTATGVLPPDPVAAITAGEPGTGGAAGYGNSAFTDAAGHWGSSGATFPVGTVIFADSSVGTTGPQLLYAAIGAGNLRAYVQGQDDVGHQALAN
jgi:hypothetical protein